MTKVKICGLSTKEAVRIAVQAGADYIGFVFAPSKRRVSIQQAQQLALAIPQTVKKVGVFVNPSRQDLKEHIEQIPLDLVQIHGNFDESNVTALSVPTIYAIQVTGSDLKVNSKADYYLFDAPMAGSGQAFDWQQLDTSLLQRPFFIAGGLTADNVQSAIERFHPYAVDVSSGVETNGVKNLNKIKKFIESVKV